MKRTSQIVVVLALVLAIAAPFSARRTAAQDEAVPRDVLILLDVTRSMKGEGDPPTTTNIWDQVRQTVKDLLAQEDPNSFVAIAPFSNGIQPTDIWPEAMPASTDFSADPMTFQQLTDENRAAADAHIDELDATGVESFICTALTQGLEQLALRRPTDGSRRDQIVYLFTDGDDTSPECSGDFSQKLAEVYGAAATDYQYLHTVYVDLNGSLGPGFVPPPGLVPVTGIPLVVSIQSDTTDLGNLYDQPAGAPLKLHVVGSLPNDGQNRVLNYALSGLHLEGSEQIQSIPLQSEMTITVKAAADIQPGNYAGTIALTPGTSSEAAAFIIVNDNDFPFTYSWNPPAPTPTVTPLAPTATPPPTATPTPVPTATPIPTPTPAANLRVEQEAASASIGTVTVCSDDALAGTRGPAVIWDEAAQAQGASVELVATVNGTEDSDRFWIEGANGEHVSRLTVGPANDKVTLGYRLEGSEGCSIWNRLWPLPVPGVDGGQLQLSAPEPSGVHVQFIDEDGQPVDTLRYDYDAKRVFGVLHIIEWLILLALFLVLAQARFPKKAVIEVQCAQYRLRRMSQSGARWFYPKEIAINGQRRQVIDVRTGAVVGYVTPRRSPLTLFRREVYVRPVFHGDESPLHLGGTPITKPYRLPRGTTVDVLGGESFTRRS